VSDVRAWIVRKLREDARPDPASKDAPPEFVGDHGVRIIRGGRPDALIYCIGLRQSEAFDLEDLERAVSELPGVQFVAVVPTCIAHAVYERAEEIGLSVDGFSELAVALRDDDDVSRHMGREHAYVVRRLRAHKVVRSVRRRGLSAYEIVRLGLPSLTIVTSDDYELTADRVYSLLESYSGLAVDAVATTNPNARGLSSDSVQAGQRAGVRVLLFADVLDALGERWT
jgi:hypothetical protein